MDPEEIDFLCKEHEEFRKMENYKVADDIRDYLKSKGVIVESTKDGRSRWRYE